MSVTGSRRAACTAWTCATATSVGALHGEGARHFIGYNMAGLTAGFNPCSLKYI